MASGVAIEMPRNNAKAIAFSRWNAIETRSRSILTGSVFIHVRGCPRFLLPSDSLVVRFEIFLVGLVACGGVGETQGRPRAPQRVERAPSTTPLAMPLADPETAFAEPHAASADRFATRRIGAADDVARFRGAAIDLDVKGADIHDVCRLIADVGRVNIVVASEVIGTVTLTLKRVPWDQALDVVLQARGLVAVREGNVIVVRASRAAER
jgi:hypothetical protein